jgi:hypothetical protein
VSGPWQSKQRRSSTGRIRVSKNAESRGETVGGAAESVAGPQARITMEIQIRIQPIYSKANPHGMHGV